MDGQSLNSIFLPPGQFCNSLLDFQLFFLVQSRDKLLKVLGTEGLKGIAGARTNGETSDCRTGSR
jgi:hypothetical protein